MSPLCRRWLAAAAGAISLLGACVPAPTPLPTEAELSAQAPDSRLPIYQLLYDAPLQPATQTEQQRVRMLLWLQRLALSDGQLEQLHQLHRATAERRDSIAAAEQEAARRWAEQAAPTYAALEALLLDGVPADDPRMTQLAEQLAAVRAEAAPEDELLRIRMQGIRATLEAEGDFLRTLSPAQEIALLDGLFVLRSHLDPVGTPGDFRALVGTTYDPGQYAVLTRGTGASAADQLNIAGLWSDDADQNSPVFHQARREVLLYLALIDPALGEALQRLRAQAPPTPAAP